MVSPDGQEADVNLSKSKLATADGKPLTDQGGGFDFGFITGAELLRKDCAVEWLIPNVMAKGQHHILGGPLKCCKTLIATDLSVSLATGGMSQLILVTSLVERPVTHDTHLRRIGLACVQG